MTGVPIVPPICSSWLLASSADGIAVPGCGTALTLTAKSLTVGPNAMTSIWSASASSWSSVTPMVLAASAMAALSPDSSSSRKDSACHPSGTGNRMPVSGASTQLVPLGGFGVPVGDGDALVVPAVLAEPAEPDVVVFDGACPAHPATARAAMVTATDDLRTVVFPLMAHTVAGSEERPSAALRGPVA